MGGCGECSGSEHRSAAQLQGADRFVEYESERVVAGMRVQASDAQGDEARVWKQYDHVRDERILGEWSGCLLLHGFYVFGDSTGSLVGII